jgi:hypothetical protein
MCLAYQMDAYIARSPLLKHLQGSIRRAIINCDQLKIRQCLLI